MNFETVIGIEIHCELLTKTKMFSGSRVSYHSLPNTNVNEIDMALPGALPTLNKRAVEQALKACLLFNLDIDTLLRFDRKNYFYPDLPKGFQITQDEFPIGNNGYIDIDLNDYQKRINITRLHMEEDTAKQIHKDDYTLIDYNRSGNPLIEIVSDASIRSAAEAMKYVETLRLMLVYANISNAKMEEGSLRCDINVSLRPYGSEKYGTKVEIKNMNSISNIQRALDFEIKRQEQILLSGQEVISETRRYDDSTKTTVSMRQKDGFIDYRYHSEPNILPTRISQDMIESVKKEIPLMPNELINVYTNEYQLSKVDASILVNDPDLAKYFNEAIKHTNEYQLVANWIISEILSYLNKENLSINECVLKPQSLALMINLMNEEVVSSKQLKQIFNIVIKENNDDINDIIKKHKLALINDEKEILVFINEVLEKNPQSIVDYHSGKDNALKFMVGQIMKLSAGQVNPSKTDTLLKNKLEEYK